MGFEIRYEDILAIANKLNMDIPQLHSGVDSCKNRINLFASNQDFTGLAAESIKKYFTEIHGVLLENIDLIANIFVSKLDEYQKGMKSIDHRTGFVMPEDCITDFAVALFDTITQANSNNEDINHVIFSINDILDIRKLSLYEVNQERQNITSKNRTLCESIRQYESNYVVALQGLSEYIECLKQSVVSLVNNRNINYAQRELPNLDKLKQYQSLFELYEKIKNGLLTGQDLKQIKGEELQELLFLNIPFDLSLLKMGKKLEYPIGPGVTAYCSVSGETKGMTDAQIDMAIKNNAVAIKKLKMKGKLSETTDINFELNDDNSLNYGASVKASGNLEVKININDHGFSQKIKINDSTTATVSLKQEQQKISIEEEIESTIGGGSVNTLYGLSVKNNNTNVQTDSSCIMSKKQRLNEIFLENRGAWCKVIDELFENSRIGIECSMFYIGGVGFAF